MTDVLAELLTFGVGGLLVLFATVVTALRQERRIRFDVFVDTCDRLRLSRDGRVAVGKVDGVGVTIEPRGRDEERDPRLWVEVDGPIPIDLKLGAYGIASFAGVDVTVGEPRFDQPVQVQAADPFAAVALFDAETRDAVAAAIAAGAWFAAGRWRIELRQRDADEVVRALRTLARAHRAVAAAAARSPVAALTSIADGDRHAGVRLRALELLVSRGVVPRVLLERRSQDLDLAVRTAAAAALGADGVEALRGVVRDGSRTWRVRAACAVAAHVVDGPAAREAEDALLAALEDPDLARASAMGLLRVGTARAVDPLTRAASNGPFDARRAAREALAAIRARLDPSRAGALSLAAAEEGALSEPTPGGAVALVPEREP